MVDINKIIRLHLDTSTGALEIPTVLSVSTIQNPSNKPLVVFETASGLFKSWEKGGWVPLITHRFVRLEDTPATIQARQHLVGNAQGTALEFVAPPSFRSLTDTPTGLEAGKIPAVNAQGTALVWIDPSQTGAPIDSFLLLKDTPATFQADKLVAVNPQGTGLVFIDAPAETFLSLKDTPSSWAAGKILAVKTGGGIEYIDLPTTGSILSLTDTPGTYQNGYYLQSTASGTRWHRIAWNDIQSRPANLDLLASLSLPGNGGKLLALNSAADDFELINAPQGGSAYSDDATNTWEVFQKHGVVGDGVADDSSGLQAAVLEILEDGRNIVFPSGTYRLTKPVKFHRTLYSDTLRILGYGAKILIDFERPFTWTATGTELEQFTNLKAWRKACLGGDNAAFAFGRYTGQDQSGDNGQAWQANIEGFFFEGQGKRGVVAFQVDGLTHSSVRNISAANCWVGIMFFGWNCNLYGLFANNCFVDHWLGTASDSGGPRGFNINHIANVRGRGGKGSWNNYQLLPYAKIIVDGWRNIIANVTLEGQHARYGIILNDIGNLSQQNVIDQVYTELNAWSDISDTDTWQLAITDGDGRHFIYGWPPERIKVMNGSTSSAFGLVIKDAVFAKNYRPVIEGLTRHLALEGIGIQWSSTASADLIAHLKSQGVGSGYVTIDAVTEFWGGGFGHTDGSAGGGSVIISDLTVTAWDGQAATVNEFTHAQLEQGHGGATFQAIINVLINNSRLVPSKIRADTGKVYFNLNDVWNDAGPDFGGNQGNLPLDVDVQIIWMAQ